jgi:hypothetical protein
LKAWRALWDGATGLGIFRRPFRSGLVPLPVSHADLGALDLDRGHANTGPDNQPVDLVFTAAVADVDRMGQDAVVGKAALQRLPDGLVHVEASSNSGSIGMHFIVPRP